MVAQLEGLVLCRVGEHRLAFPAASVVQISDWALTDSPTPHARSAFALPLIAGRCIEDGQGGLVVDSLEIATDPPLMMAVPALLAQAFGGALQGFILLADALCPVLEVTAFAQFLSRSPQ